MSRFRTQASGEAIRTISGGFPGCDRSFFSQIRPRPRQAGPTDTDTMIEALKSDHIVDKVGGRFKLCSLVQRRLIQLMEGARPLVDRNGRSDLEVAIEEILQEKITLDFDPSTLKIKNDVASVGSIDD